MKWNVFVLARPMMGAFLVLSAALCVLPVASSAQTEIRSLEFAYLTLRNRSGSAEPGEVYGGKAASSALGSIIWNTAEKVRATGRHASVWGGL